MSSQRRGDPCRGLRAPRSRQLRPASDRAGQDLRDVRADFYLGVTKPMLQLVLAAVLVFVLLLRRARKRAMVPGPAAVRRRERLRLRPQQHGPRHHRQPGLHALRALPVHAVLLHPGQQLYRRRSRSSSSRRSRALGMAYALAGPDAGSSTTASGIRKHGFVGYLKLQTVPSGVNGPMLLLLVPLEFFSNILVRPVTLALRLFANMFAGHLLLILFSTGGVYLLVHGGDRLRRAGRPPGLGPRHRDRVPRDAGAVPAGLRLHPAHRHVHLRRARRRALSRTTSRPAHAAPEQRHQPKGNSRGRLTSTWSATAWRPSAPASASA